MNRQPVPQLQQRDCGQRARLRLHARPPHLLPRAMPPMSKIAVIGTGGWGTAIAALIAADASVLLWGRDATKVTAIAHTRTHPDLTDIALPAHLHVTADATQLKDAELIFWAVPTQHTRTIATQLAPHLRADAGVMSLSKGLEHTSLLRVTEVLAATLGARPLGVLAGPSHALEVARGQPACLVAAGPDALTAATVSLLHARALRLYSSSDAVGVELAGALKNVIAIAAGIGEGLGLGDNAKAAMITRGLAEIRRLGRALGAQDATFSGMAGVGDLLTTCYSNHGRNRALGLAIARGENPLELLARLHTVAEGAWTCRAAVALGLRHHIELPIASQVASVIWDATPVADAIARLLARTPKEEDA